MVGRERNSRFSCDVTNLLSAMLVHKELICICQYSHVRLYFEFSCVMSDDKTSVDCETKSQKSENSKDKCLPELSDFAKKLEGHVYTRYLQKIGVVGVDPACLVGEKLDPECLPPIESTDLLSFLVLETITRVDVPSRGEPSNPLATACSTSAGGYVVAR